MVGGSVYIGSGPQLEKEILLTNPDSPEKSLRRKAKFNLYGPISVLLNSNDVALLQLNKVDQESAIASEEITAEEIGDAEYFREGWKFYGGGKFYGFVTIHWEGTEHIVPAYMRRGTHDLIIGKMAIEKILDKSYISEFQINRANIAGAIFFPLVALGACAFGVLILYNNALGLAAEWNFVDPENFPGMGLAVSGLQFAGVFAGILGVIVGLVFTALSLVALISLPLLFIEKIQQARKSKPEVLRRLKNEISH
jgi:hypothetical protein